MANQTETYVGMSQEQLISIIMQMQKKDCLPAKNNAISQPIRDREYIPYTLRTDCRHLIIGTSRTRDLFARNIAHGCQIHTYRGGMLSELRNVILRYEKVHLKSVTVVAGYNDAANIEDDSIYKSEWEKLLTTIAEQFTPDSIIVPDTIPSTVAEHSTRVELLQESLRSYCMENKTIGSSSVLHHLPVNHMFTVSGKVASAFFCRDGVHLNAIGTNLLTSYLCGIVRSLHTMSRDEISSIRAAKSTVIRTHLPPHNAAPRHQAHVLPARSQNMYSNRSNVQNYVSGAPYNRS